MHSHPDCTPCDAHASRRAATLACARAAARDRCSIADFAMYMDSVNAFNGVLCFIKVRVACSIQHTFICMTTESVHMHCTKSADFSDTAIKHFSTS
jgi:hypothetical protein